VWCDGRSPPDLLRLADGRVLLTRGCRRDSVSVRCHLSEDEGDTWVKEVVLRADAAGSSV